MKQVQGMIQGDEYGLRDRLEGIMVYWNSKVKPCGVMVK